VLAIRAKDGLVIASDGQSTERKGGQFIRTTSDKIYPLGKIALWGASGDGGAIQEAERMLATLPAQGQKHADTRNVFGTVVFKVNKPRIERFREMKLQGEPPILAEALLVQYDGSQPRIVEFVLDGSSTNYEALGYQAIGSGGIFARASLYGYQTQSLPLDKAKVLAYMTIRKAIDIAAFGLGDPIDIWTIKGQSNAASERASGEEKKALGDATTAIVQAQMGVFS
jgi:20S proteasome alpha/beta subunit